MRDRRAEAEIRQTAAAADAETDTYSPADAALRERLNRRALGLDRDSGGDGDASTTAAGAVSAAAGAQSAMSRNVDAARRNVNLAAEIGIKSQQMADDARQFASMAKKLKERNSSWW
jgi:hypothetical protein